MNEQAESIAQLKEIRSLMERSSRFLSLSGLSGVFAGTYALIGAWLAYLKINQFSSTLTLRSSYRSDSFDYDDLALFLVADASLVLLLSVGTGLFLTLRKAKKQGQKIWEPVSKKLLINLLIPLIAGGIFCLVMMHHQLYGLILPATMIFYGMALMNAGKYTLHDVWYLGLCEIALGLIAAIYPGYGITFWAIGFGVLHILYGSIMYFKYER